MTVRGSFVAVLAYLTPTQKRRLDALAASTLIPAAVIVRAGIDAVLAQPDLIKKFARPARRRVVRRRAA